MRERFRGALLGLAAGDALGTTVEFSPPGSFSPVCDMVGGGPFDLPPGAWTDDTSMALCLAESLVECRGFDPLDQLERYRRWWRQGYLSSTGKCFDIGTATRRALQRYERTGEPYPGDADPNAAGNGPLMKLAPVALAFARDEEKAAEFAGLMARTTHGAPEAADAASVFARLIVRALNGAPKSDLLALPGARHPKVKAIDFRRPDPRGNGYIVLALEAALWAFDTSETFGEGALAAVNLGDDADTTAAIYGQLAGAYYGVDAIPQHWRDQLVMRERITELADALYELSRC
jgi:ADP-ribosylglycohydrolase